MNTDSAVKPNSLEKIPRLVAIFDHETEVVGRETEGDMRTQHDHNEPHKTGEAGPREGFRKWISHGFESGCLESMLQVASIKS